MFKGGLRQVALGFVVFVIGMAMTTPKVGTQDKAADSAPQVAKAPPAPMFQCEQGASANGAVVNVLGSGGHNLRKVSNGDKIVNEKATKILGSTQYQTIDNSTTVQIQCVDGEWARVQIQTPEWLKEHVGWVERSALAAPLKSGEVREFTEADFDWDKDTDKAKAAVIKAVNRIHREDPRCKEAIYP